MIFAVTLSPAAVRHCVEKLHLVECKRGEHTFWSSGPYAQLSGIHAVIDCNHLKLSCSVHKLYQQLMTGALDNSGECTLSQAVSTIDGLLSGLHIPPESVHVRYMEIGLSIRMAHDPLSYISQMLSVAKDKSGLKREMFIDYHYERDRMRITSKTRFVRKVLKVYDKTFEARSKDREVEPNVLRVETQYKRMNTPLLQVLSDEELGKMLTQFYADWSDVQWVRTVRGEKGVRSSELVKATEIINMGVGSYLDMHRKEHRAGAISDKAWRTHLRFASQWPQMSSRFIQERGPLEAEFATKFHDAYVTARA